MSICFDKRGYDKLLHFLIGVVVCLIAGVTFAHIPPHRPWLSVVVALAAVIVVAALKEVHDAHAKGNHFCLWDFLWTVTGGVAMCWVPGIVAALFVSSY